MNCDGSFARIQLSNLHGPVNYICDHDYLAMYSHVKPYLHGPVTVVDSVN